MDVHSKPTNISTYALPTTCYPRKSINNTPHGIALWLRRIFDSDEKFKHRSEEYKNYLIARDYHPGLVDKQFQKVERKLRRNARKRKTKRKGVTKVKFTKLLILAYPVLKVLLKNPFTIYIQMKFQKRYFLIKSFLLFKNVKKPKGNGGIFFIPQA